MDGAPSRESGGARRFLGSSFTLLVLVGLGAIVASRILVRPVDGAAKTAEYFGARPPPFGLELSEALRLPTQDVVLRFTARSPGATGTAGPDEVTLIEYRSAAALEPLFHGAEAEDGDPAARQEEWEREHAFAW